MKADTPRPACRDAGQTPHGGSAGHGDDVIRVLAVIPTLNEARTIARVLEELHQDLPASADVLFVVCDGGSTDGTGQVVRELVGRYPFVTLLHNPKGLQSAAVNLAAAQRHTQADVLVRCDAHAHYPPGFIRQLLASLKAHGSDAVVVPMESIGGSCLQSAVAWTSDSLIGSGGSAHRGGQRSGFVDHGHHAAFRMASFLRAGGYDETFSHNEDAEFDCRQRSLGSRIFLDAGIRITYIPRGTWAGLWRQYFQYGRGRSRTIRRHPGSARLRQLAVPLHLAACAATLALAPWFLWGLVWPAAYAAALAMAAISQSVRHRSPCGLLCGPTAAVMHTAWACGFFVGLATLRERPWRADTAQALRPAAPPPPAWPQGMR